MIGRRIGLADVNKHLAWRCVGGSCPVHNDDRAKLLDGFRGRRYNRQRSIPSNPFGSSFSSDLFCTICICLGSRVLRLCWTHRAIRTITQDRTAPSAVFFTMQRPRIILALQLAALVSFVLGDSTTIKLYRKNPQLDAVASRASQNVVCESPTHEPNCVELHSISCIRSGSLYSW